MTMARSSNGKVRKARIVKSLPEGGVYFEQVKFGFKLLEVIRERRQKVVVVPAFISKLPTTKLNTLPSKTPLRTKPRHCNYSYKYPIGLMSDSPLEHRVDLGKLSLGELPPKETRTLTMGNYARVVTVRNCEDVLARYLVIGRTSAETEEDVEWEMIKYPERFTLLLVEGDKKHLPAGYDHWIQYGFTGWVCDGYFFTGETLNIESEMYYAKPDDVSSNEKNVTLKLGKKTINIPKDEVEDEKMLRIVAYRSNNRLFNKVTNKTYAL